MVRSGMVKMLSAGIYSFLPLGYKVIKTINNIIREEMDAIGGQEFHLPAINPIEIWEATNRVEAFGDTMFHIKNRDYVLAPTHEEIMTFHAKGVLKSYKEPEENEEVLKTFLNKHPKFVLKEPCVDKNLLLKINYSDKLYKTFTPVHNTDCFFYGYLKKTAE